MAYSDRIAEAFALAHELHQHQVRKGSGVPYIAHPMAVAALVAEFGGSEEQVAAALLHDTVEDCGGLPVLERIREQFGDRVADYVWQCSDSHEAPKPPWQDRKEEHVRVVTEGSPELKLIIAADKLHNGRAILRDLQVHGDAIWARFKGGKDATLWYYHAMAKGLRKDWDHPILDELDHTLHALDNEVKAMEEAS